MHPDPRSAGPGPAFHRSTVNDTGRPDEVAAAAQQIPVQNLPEVQKQFDADGATVLRMSPAQFGAYMVADMNKWERVVKDGGIKAQ